MDHYEFKLKYYFPRDPVNSVCILFHHVCCLDGVEMVNILCDNRFIQSMHSTIENSNVVDLAKGSMPQDALKNLIWCIYFSADQDDKGEDGWESFYYYTDKREDLKKAGTAEPWEKFGCLEDVYNVRWQTICKLQMLVDSRWECCWKTACWCFMPTYNGPTPNPNKDKKSTQSKHKHLQTECEIIITHSIRCCSGTPTGNQIHKMDLVVLCLVELVLRTQSMLLL